MTEFPKQIEDQLWGQLGVQLGVQLRGQLGVQLGVQLRDRLWDQLGDQLRVQLWVSDKPYLTHVLLDDNLFTKLRRIYDH